jgi:hypothetical protein
VHVIDLATYVDSQTSCDSMLKEKYVDPMQLFRLIRVILSTTGCIKSVSIQSRVEDRTMNAIYKMIVSSALIAAPLTLHAEQATLSDMYQYTENSPYQLQASTTPARNVNVTLSDAYGYERYGAFSNPSQHEIVSSERSEFAVFVNQPGAAIPGYIGEY